ncbi:hypothetical protein CROQUDRAFT_664702 [Cronartium quercuum f. sp. fusiforme G11]|uniref:Uncharacterized protein n=1 Tax=Cronartium quercuum f. sp. fusiforme G11 TaxID=708437 RepID=A0A9P6T6A1_9BASI|nr:hypothetical protein CROQUDRAFT_664702 [Cronartium quercuum f. sp. fusiforme G11]
MKPTFSRSIAIVFSAAFLFAPGGCVFPFTSTSSLNSTNLTNNSIVNATASAFNSTVSAFNATVTNASNAIGLGKNVSVERDQAEPFAFVEASHLFTLKLDLGLPLSVASEESTSRAVRNILNGTITGKVLNASIIGGIAYPIAQWSNASASPPVTSASFWGITPANKTVFITQTRVGSVGDERLGRLQ